MGWLDGKVALVTGGGSGIGRAVVERFLDEGAQVGVLERVTARVQQMKTDFGKAVVAVQGDVTRLEDNQRAVDETVRAYGQLDIFVGNAGIFDRFVSLADFPAEKLSEAFDELFGVNVKGCILGAKAALPELLKTEGCMIFTASVAGFFPGGGGPLYTASKHAVVGLIRQLACELAPKVRVNGVAPGGTLTDLRGLASMGQQQSPPRTPDEEARLRPPRDHAAAYVFLASKENSGQTTGAIIDTSSGASVRSIRTTARETAVRLGAEDR
jgi:NAD(P)-dependent dehydrogenase (short-subunit alcohol dehydrogenase family)